MKAKTAAIEMVLFTPVTGLTNEEVIRSLESLNPILNTFPGFISRRVCRRDDGSWMDLVTWESMELAKAAAENIMSYPDAAKAFEVIEEKSIRMNHYILQMLWDAVEADGLKALVARSADFYGPVMNKQSSFLVEGVFKPLYQGKKANWLGSDRFSHSFTYTPDAGRATALLGNTPDAYNQTWHLPTAPNPPTGKEWVELIAVEMDKNVVPCRNQNHRKDHGPFYAADARIS